ncbi:damage-inducible protein CinA [Flavobacterium akiainvivens]|uniref:Damage-inducible protein CinA n=1 Tax=Flavobacterium akiainvivens TaxID=1202724 RepID=A0A0M8MBQ2_9FLAO|nr:CinA family protein [Flavobacterium akiainvivens]KOS07823.1 damage-inducible protein CinA [Flavobacterium akiainvivens]SFQ27053.1 nicotinamide-nucleotide amidase [Flavobacterium akiainvivens]
MATESIILCSRRIAEKHLKVAVAESATAGRLATAFALTPDSGQIFLGGLVCYDACTKEELLNIPPEIIEKFTAESAEVTQLLAERLTKFFKTDVAIAITGLTSPGGSEKEDKPVGTMFIHIKIPNGVYCAHREVFSGTPETIINKAVARTGELLCNLLDSVSTTSV